MLKRWIQFIKKYLSFSKEFVHPVINEQLDRAIEDKLRKRRVSQIEETEKYTEILNSYLKTYFSKTYNNTDEMAVAYGLINKQWEELCRNVNGTNKLINIKKGAFKERVKLTIQKINETKAEKK